MITLYTFGPAFGLPDPSPFVTKAEVLLKMAGMPFRTDTEGFNKAPKGKLPISRTTASASPIRPSSAGTSRRKYKFDFDRGLSAEQRAIAWAFEKMAEDNLYWAGLDARWMDDANFYKGPVKFFGKVPAPLRPIVVAMVRRQVRKRLQSHGMGRHSGTEIAALGTRSIDAIADYLGQKPFFMGAEPTGVDATMFAFVAGMLCPVFDTPLRTAAERHDNLKRYVGRMTARFYPELGEIAGVKAAA